MLVRWYQVGAFAPFFRAHAHIDTKRREPFLLDEPYKGIVKDILRLRYTLLPMWYTAFRETTVTGMPILRCDPLMKTHRWCRVSDVRLCQASIYHVPQGQGWF
jgi:alpha-glucosidase (family GH31 glycosyl hydrolase)